MIAKVVDWLLSAEHRSDIVTRTLEHLQYSLLALLGACLVAIPLGLYIGHTGRGRVAVVTIVNGARALPTLGLLFALVLWLGPHLGSSGWTVPAMIVLVVLAIPPILAGTYAGVDEVDPVARDAAKGMGMRGAQVLREVEIPCALPLIFSGVRSALLQLVATATIAATVGLGGLGRFLIDGQALKDYPQMAGGAVLVAVLALVLDLLLALVQRYTVSRGLTRRYRGEAAPDASATTAATEPAQDTLEAGLVPGR